MDFYRFALTLALAAPPGARGAALSTQWSLTSGDCPSDCHNRGACRGGRCYCVAGWGGKACDVKQCSVCAHGKCIDGECVCDAGFMGRQCRERTCPSDCHNHGACHDGVCDCADGYEGADCGSMTTTPPPASRAPSTFATAKAGAGIAPVTGAHPCATARGAASLPCGLQGYCKEGACVCHAGWSGPRCQEAVSYTHLTLPTKRIV